MLGRLRSVVGRPWSAGSWTMVRLVAALVLALLAVAGSVAVGVSQPDLAKNLGLVEQAACGGLCQGCYCDQIINGQCYVNGRPSACIGCVGSCVSNQSCQCRAGKGGCGRVIAWCRSSDCAPRATPMPTPTPRRTPTPTPPACTERIYNHVQPPQVAKWWYEPEHPTVVGQDPTFRGFDLFVQAQGGFAETRQVKLEQVCPDGSTDPAACSQSWRWQCREQVLAHYNDPIVAIDVAMRLADSSTAWLQDDLAPRYPGAHTQEGLPRVFVLWRGRAMTVDTALRDYKAQDPGIHGGKILALTQGTPLNPPQRIEQPYAVPVYLMDATIEK